MSDTTTFQDIINLGSYSFVAGGYQELIFYVVDTNGAAVSLSGATCSWKMSPYGQSDIVTLSKSGSITSESGGIFKITLESADTIALSGIYAHQPIVTSFDGTIYNPGQGQLIIIPLIQ